MNERATQVRTPKAGECWHDGKGLHVRISERNTRATWFRRPYELTDRWWWNDSFDKDFHLCDKHPAFPRSPLT